MQLKIVWDSNTDFVDIRPPPNRRWSIDFNSLVFFDYVTWKIRLKKQNLPAPAPQKGSKIFENSEGSLGVMRYIHYTYT